MGGANLGAQAILLLGGEGAGVAVHETVEGRVIGDEGGLVSVEGDSPDEREIVFGLRIFISIGWVDKASGERVAGKID